MMIKMREAGSACEPIETRARWLESRVVERLASRSQPEHDGCGPGPIVRLGSQAEWSEAVLGTNEVMMHFECSVMNRHSHLTLTLSGPAGG